MSKVYGLKIAQAMMVGDDKTVSKVFEEALLDMTKSCMDLLTSYSSIDLPIMVAAMQIVSGSMKGVLSEGESRVVDKLVSSTKCVVIAAEALRQQQTGE